MLKSVDDVNQVLFKEFRIINFCGKQHETHYQKWSCFIIFLTMNALTTIIRNDSNIEFHVWLKIISSKTSLLHGNDLANRISMSILDEKSDTPLIQNASSSFKDNFYNLPETNIIKSNLVSADLCNRILDFKMSRHNVQRYYSS